MPFQAPQDDDSGEPVRQSRPNNPGGSTGSGGAGGISGFSAGAGASFQGLGQGSGLTGYGPTRKRFYTMADQTQQMPGANSTAGMNFAQGGPVSGGPPGTDTVNAHLNNGEFVVNRDAAQNPQNAMELERMNGGPGGGQGSPSMDSGMSPALSRAALVELLSVLLSEDDSMPGYKLGGWVGQHKWAIPAAAILAAVTAPLWAPAAGAALGIGGAGAASAGAAGAAGGTAGATTIGAGSAAGLSYGPMAAATPLSHIGFLTAHPAIAGMLAAGKTAAPYAEAGYQQHQGQGAGRRAQENADTEEALARYNAARSEDLPGMAAGGWWGAGGTGGWSYPGAKGKPQARPAGGPLTQPAPVAPAPVATPQGNSYDPAATPWATPNALSSLQEAGSRDANNYASGVYRNAQLMGADPGAAASYKLSALASAGRGSADALSKYRTDYATSEASRLFELEKQRRDEYYQEKLKRVH